MRSFKLARTKQKDFIIMIITIVLITILGLFSSNSVNAVTNSVTVETDKTNLEVGETFKVRINAVVPDGINGLATTYNYDSKKLEIIEKKLLDSNFIDLGGTESNEIVVLFNPEDASQFTKITETDLYELIFKVKEKARGKATIELGEIDLNTLSATNAEHKLSVDEITFKIISNRGKTNLTIIVIIAIIAIGGIFLLKNKRKIKR